MQLNFQAFLFSLVVLPSIANGQIFSPGDKETLRAAVNEVVLGTFDGTPIKDWDVSEVTDMDQLFFNKDFDGDLSDWNVGKVTSMDQMFEKAASFNGDISGWNVEKVTSMQSMFAIARLFNQNLNNWDVASVTDMSAMFWSANAFDGDISNWKVDKVTTMNQMFRLAKEFNQDLSTWNVASVTDMTAMFFQANSFNGDISAWDVASVTDMFAMFWSANAFDGDISNWKVDKVTTMDVMFRDAISFNGDISAWDVASVTDMGYMFYGAKEFNQDLSTWNVASVSDMNAMFRLANVFNQNLCCWGTRLAESTTVTDMFSGAGCTDTSNPVPTSGTIPNFCQACGTNPCSTGLTALEAAWNIEPLEFVQNGNSLTITSQDSGPGGVLEWKVYQSNVAASTITDVTSACFSSGGEEYSFDVPATGLSEVEVIVADTTGGVSSLTLSIVDGIETNGKVYSAATAGTSPEVFFCVFLGLKAPPAEAEAEAEAQFFSFEELAFKVTMELNGGFTVDAFPVDAKDVDNQEASTNYGVKATVGACGEIVDVGFAYNQGAAVPICVCPDETFTTVSSFTGLKFETESRNFEPASEGVIVATSVEYDGNVAVEGMSCKQIDSLLPQFFFNADAVTSVTATGTVELIIRGRRRTAEINLRSLQNVEEKEFGAEFELAPATAEAESSAMSLYGKIAGMASVLLAAAMI